MQDDEPKDIAERPQWDNQVQYLLTCIGFTVGLGSVWRFPYLCQTYGGGAFLIPYAIALVFEGLPLLHIELAIGQRLRMGSIGVWNSISPYMGGLGVASLAVSFLISLFYNMIIAWILWYLFHSFQSPLPWRDCPINLNHTGYVSECEKASAVNYFWYRETLNITPNIETSGSFQWWLAIYVTVSFPYLVLTIFLIKSLTLPGATDGLIYLFTPDWETLKNPDVWLDASTQIFFSMCLGFGGLIAFSSYSIQKNNCERDAIIVGFMNTFTSIYASIPIFAILGFKANENFNKCRNWNILRLTNSFNIGNENITLENYDDWFNHFNNTDPSEVESLNLKTCNLQTFLDESASGTGLAFIVFTEAVIHMPGLICLTSFTVALIFTLGSGNYWLGIFNNYVGSMPLLIIAFFEIISVVYIYGINRFNDDIEWMTGRRPNIYWQATWRFISPLMLLVVFVAYVVVAAEKRPTYNAWNPDHVNFPLADVQPYPEWVYDICVLLSVLPIVSIPLVAFYRFMGFLKNTALTIAIQRDWIVVITGYNRGHLAGMNATMRRIDQVTNILAPLAVGQVMTLASNVVGCGFILGWNLVSLIVEFFFLSRVYRIVPALSIKPPVLEEEEDQVFLQRTERRMSQGESTVAPPQPQPLTEGNCNSSLHLKEITNLPLCFQRFRWLVSTCKDGWRAYYRQPVFLAGMGLAFLYTTVLGFDCITTGYAYTQGISGSLLSLLMGVSAITGLMGTVMFTRLRKSYGLVNTGIISSCLHLGCLLLCVCSVFAPGSPMDLSLLMPYITSNSSTDLGGMTSQRQKHTYALRGGSNQPLLPDRSSIHWTNNTVLFDNVPSDAAPESYISIILLFLGVITARIGLWSFDLTVTQLLQENICESERGVVNGVQSSMNYLMDLLHFIMVISAPQPQHFGILVIISVLFITTGHTMYFLYAHKAKRKRRLDT
ncbi:hypothetical protein JOQ06_025864 [Pogonophryne albipinna]|uniref:Transporter n=1 Tax=Pogonophryne albipinna TaxID=1090488 RepID=A0AAD6AV29_9TELE|nr:hypothetical protein JOQ06_025864 [Pogonophryne albipinna]